MTVNGNLDGGGCHQMSGVGECPRFVRIQFGNVLAMCAATRIVWTEPCRRAVTSTRLGSYYLGHFVLLRILYHLPGED